MNPFTSQVERRALISLEKRGKLESLAGDQVLQPDVDAGVVRLQERLDVPFQALGTESENTLTWLWAWADEQPEIPEARLRSARELRSWLERSGFDTLTRPSLDLDKADGTLLAIVATEVCQASAFYRDSYEGGALIILLWSPEIDRQPGFDRGGLVRALRDLVERYDLDPRALLTSYFEGRGLPHALSANVLNAQLETGERLIAEFDDAGRLLTLNGDPLF